MILNFNEKTSHQNSSLIISKVDRENDASRYVSGSVTAAVYSLESKDMKYLLDIKQLLNERDAIHYICTYTSCGCPLVNCVKLDT
jgi:hypothetical protein